MSSKYAEKRHAGARCSICGEKASKLTLIVGKPHWVCADHYQEGQKK